MDQIFVEKMRITDVISARFYVKNCQFVQFCCVDNYVLEVKISQASDTTRLYRIIVTCNCITKDRFWSIAVLYFNLLFFSKDKM